MHKNSRTGCFDFLLLLGWKTLILSYRWSPMWEAYGGKKNSKLWKDFSKFRKASTPKAKGGAVLLNILVFLNSNTCSARTTHKNALIYCVPLHFRFNLTINSSHVNLCANKDTHILNIRNAGNKLIFNFVLVFHLSTSKWKDWINHVLIASGAKFSVRSGILLIKTAEYEIILSSLGNFIRLSILHLSVTWEFVNYSICQACQSQWDVGTICLLHRNSC